MNHIDSDSLADIEFRLKWGSADGTHTDILFARNANMWRDCFPGEMHRLLMAKAPGEQAAVDCTTAEFGAASNLNRKLDLKRSQFLEAGGPPKEGRFYPQGLLKEVAGVYPANTRPFRCTRVGEKKLSADLNHPLAGRRLNLEALIRNVRPKPYERGGGLTHWLEAVADGPGMQVRYNGSATDFLTGDALSREDESPDSLFYRSPRMVQHIDSRAVEEISRLYGRLFASGDTLLDLMASWTSHLPEQLMPRSVTGLGLNGEELDANRRLTRRVVQDLNIQPRLPFDDHAFDGVMCTVSVEYLIHPLAVFKEVSRVLRPGGRFVVTVSNRWFPPKAIRVWKELHEFERMGLVVEYFLRSGAFKELQTLSIRGLPRPADDKYYPQMMLSDPVYAVWGQV